MIITVIPNFDFMTTLTVTIVIKLCEKGARDITTIQHLEGHGDLVSRLISPISHIITPIIPIINLLTKSP